MERALRLGATLIGINNRDLRTFKVDLAVTERLAPWFPKMLCWLEKAASLPGEDARRMRLAGMDAVLVGESLIVAPDRAQAIEQIKLDEPTGSEGVTLLPDRPLIKICGLRQFEHAQVASDAGADLVGFIFTPVTAADDRGQCASDRRRSFRDAAIPTGIFVDEPVDEIN